MAKFLLLAHDEPFISEPGTTAGLRACLEYDRALVDSLAASAELLHDVHLTGPAQARVITGTAVGGAAGDRPLLARYWIVDVTGVDRACEIARMWSGASGHAGRPIEVRALMEDTSPHAGYPYALG